jgi:hypothetical protein
MIYQLPAFAAEQPAYAGDNNYCIKDNFQKYEKKQTKNKKGALAKSGPVNYNKVKFTGFLLFSCSAAKAGS